LTLQRKRESKSQGKTETNNTETKGEKLKQKEIQCQKLTKYSKSKQDVLFLIRIGCEQQRLGCVQNTPPLNSLASEERQKKERGVNRRCFFIPSLSISSTASLTRRITVTMEAR